MQFRMTNGCWVHHAVGEPSDWDHPELELELDGFFIRLWGRDLVSVHIWPTPDNPTGRAISPQLLDHLFGESGRLLAQQKPEGTVVSVHGGGLFETLPLLRVHAIDSLDVRRNASDPDYPLAGIWRDDAEAHILRGEVTPTDVPIEYR